MTDGIGAGLHGLNVFFQDHQSLFEVGCRFGSRERDAQVACLFPVAAEEAVGMVDADAAGQKLLFDGGAAVRIRNGQPTEKAVRMAAEILMGEIACKEGVAFGGELALLLDDFPGLAGGDDGRDDLGIEGRRLDVDVVQGFQEFFPQRFAEDHVGHAQARADRLRRTAEVDRLVRDEAAQGPFIVRQQAGSQEGHDIVFDDDEAVFTDDLGQRFFARFAQGDCRRIVARRHEEEAVQLVLPAVGFQVGSGHAFPVAFDGDQLEMIHLGQFQKISIGIGIDGDAAARVEEREEGQGQAVLRARDDSHVFRIGFDA